jgi:CRP/FNR family transcriptional regulator
MNSMALLDGFFRQRPARLYRKSTVIFDAGQSPDGLFYMVSGRAQLTTVDERGQDCTLYTLGPGDPFPLAPFFLGQSHATSYMAMTDVEAIWRPRSEVDSFLDRHPAALREIIGFVLTVFYMRVKDLSFSTTERRVVIRLMYLAQRFGVHIDGSIELTITQQELADSVNLTRESISLMLNQLQDAGVVLLHRNKILVYIERANDLVKQPD